MKKVNLISLAVVVGSLAAISLTSCKKEKEGIYNPEAKISKVYYEYYAVLSDGKREPKETLKELQEVWKWEKDKLMSIEAKESGYSWTLHFIYDKKQITKIESGNMVFNFIYEDKKMKKLKKIEVVDDKTRPYLNITLDERNEEKVTQLTYEHFTYTEVSDAKVFVSKLQPVMNIMLGDNLGETMVKSIEENVKMHKATTTTKTTTKVELTYDGNNVSEEKRTVTVDNNSPTISSTISWFRYKYDGKINPYYLAFCLIFDNYFDATSAITPLKPDAFYASSSENNIESYFKYEKDTKGKEITVDSATYVYKYDSHNFPIERDKQSKTEDGTVHHYVHTYEYVATKK